MDTNDYIHEKILEGCGVVPQFTYGEQHPTIKFHGPDLFECSFGIGSIKVNLKELSKIVKDMTIKQSEEKAVLNGAVVINAFKGAVRSDDLNTLEKGDKFTIPENYTILEQAVGTGGNKAQFIVVDVNGVPKNFYPSSLTKNLAIVTEDCIPTGERAKTSGAVCDWFKKQVSVDAAMKELKGCTLVISDMKPYLTKVFGSVADTRNSNFMTVDFAEGSRKPAGA